MSLYVFCQFVMIDNIEPYSSILVMQRHSVYNTCIFTGGLEGRREKSILLDSIIGRTGAKQSDRTLIQQTRLPAMMNKHLHLNRKKFSVFLFSHQLLCNICLKSYRMLPKHVGSRQPQILAASTKPSSKKVMNSGKKTCVYIQTHTRTHTHR